LLLRGEGFYVQRFNFPNFRARENPYPRPSQAGGQQISRDFSLITNLKNLFMKTIQKELPPSKRPRGAQPGNSNAVKHGFYSRKFHPQELNDLDLLLAANQVKYVVGLVEEPIFLHCIAATLYAATPYTAVIGIGHDSQSVSTPTMAGFGNVAAGGIAFPYAVFNAFPLLGYHYLCMLETPTSAIAVTFYGDNGLTYQQSGGFGWLFA
jgi:hypothetical protein